MKLTDMKMVDVDTLINLAHYNKHTTDKRVLHEGAIRKYFSDINVPVSDKLMILLGAVKVILNDKKAIIYNTEPKVCEASLLLTLSREVGAMLCWAQIGKRNSIEFKLVINYRGTPHIYAESMVLSVTSKQLTNLRDNTLSLAAMLQVSTLYNTEELVKRIKWLCKINNKVCTLKDNLSYEGVIDYLYSSPCQALNDLRARQLVAANLKCSAAIGINDTEPFIVTAGLVRDIAKKHNMLLSLLVEETNNVAVALVTGRDITQCRIRTVIDRAIGIDSILVDLLLFGGNKPYILTYRISPQVNNDK